MGSQMREALKCLCDEIGWSYAVFWRLIGSRSPMHLVWGDGHVVDSRVEVLVNKIFAQQIHVVGEGVLGQVAATGSHCWITADNINVNGLGAQDFAQLNPQILAGIQAITLIPVLPYGVLQLGSIQMIMENIEFVNRVKNVFSQLEGMTGYLLPDNNPKDLGQNSQLCDGIPVIASEMLPQKLTITAKSVPLSDAIEPMIHSDCKPIFHSNNQLERRARDVQDILCNPDLGLIQQGFAHDSTSKYQDQFAILTSDSSSTSLTFPEQPLAMCINPWGSVKRLESDSGNVRTLPLRYEHSIFPDSLNDSNMHLSSPRNSASDNHNTFGRFISLPGGTSKASRTPYTDLFHLEAGQISIQKGQSKSNQGIPIDTSPTHLHINTSESVIAAASQRHANSVFEASDAPSESDVNGLCGVLLNTLKECRLNNSNDFQENRTYMSDIYDDSTHISQFASNIEDNEESKFSPAFSSQPSGNGLYDILGLDYKIDSYDGSFGCLLENKNNTSDHELAAENSSACMTHLDKCPNTHSVDDHISGVGMFSTADANQLLDAVVSKVNSGVKDNFESSKTSVKSICCPSVASVSPCFQMTLSSGHTQVKSYSLPLHLGSVEALGSSSAKSACSFGNETEDCSQSVGSKSQISLWVESGQSMNSDNLSGGHNKKLDEVGKPNRKRARPGENPRPRPKDRQMIMDRVKELREIVPNGAKCSIDALLEKTIKHMLFLQSVSKHVDNLKNIGEPKFIDKEGGVLLKEKFEGGATWAFEVGRQSMACPVIVEDLNPPRQMLVEMLCEQRGFFLEIADLIRGLGLTILKGVMEAHKDKIWARFAVEANRDVTRMELFLSLVHLLESTVCCTTVPQGVDNINMTNNIYHQSCVAATGSSNHLL